MLLKKIAIPAETCFDLIFVPLGYNYFERVYGEVVF